MRKIKYSLFAVLLLASCAQEEKSIYTYWVNSAKVDCEGVAPMTCFQVQKSDTLLGEQWNLLYSNIEGFDFEPGFIYKLKVEEIQRDQSETPADKYSITYKLVEQLEKIKNDESIIHDLYVLTGIDGQEIDFASDEMAAMRPSLEVNTTKMKVSGSDGCNLYSALIKELSAVSIEIGPMTTTRKACKDMNIAQQYTTRLQKVTQWKRDALSLILMASDGTELLRLKKVD